MKAQNENNQSGSAILWILVAVALFGALNFAFNSSSRTGTSLLTDTEAEAYANQIIQYGNEVKNAVKRLTLRGCDDTEISFENNIVTTYTNTNAPTNRSCHVFDSAGGGLTWGNFTQLFTGDIEFENLSTSSPELTLQTSDIQSETCYAINKKLGVDNASNDYEDTVTPTPTVFTGAYGTITLSDILGDEVATFSGEKSFCHEEGGDYFYNLVLIAR